MRNSVQQILDQLHAEAGGNRGLSSYEAPVDSFEAVGYENFLVSQGFDSYTAKVTAAKATQVPAMAAKIRAAMNASNGRSGQGLVGLSAFQQPGNVLAAANFGITITRATATIPHALPFALFGWQDLHNGYRNVLSDQLPAGVTLLSVKGGENDGLPDQVEFEYTDGVNTDKVIVTSNTYPYPSLLASNAVDTMRMSKIRLELGDPSKTNQFRFDILTKSNSPFGRGSFNKISATSFKTPQQFQQGIVDIDAVFDIDKETSIISKIIAEAGFEYTWNSFLEKFDRNTAANL